MDKRWMRTWQPMKRYPHLMLMLWLWECLKSVKTKLSINLSKHRWYSMVRQFERTVRFKI